MNLNTKQSEFIKMAMAGKNCFLSGGGGVGKTFTINYFKKMIPWKKVVCTASTGIASIQQDNGMTIHSWAGLGTFNHPNQLFNIINSDFFDKIVGKIQECDVLIIDEVSMLRGDQVDLLNMVLQNARHSSKPFGGIQVIFVGDFCQLPPVIRKDEEITHEWAFESKAWEEGEVKTFILDQVMRQSDAEFINALNDIRFGHLTENAIKMLDSVRETVFPRGVSPLKLMPINKGVDEWNHKMIKSIKSEPFTSEAFIYGQTKKFYHDVISSTLAPKFLQLKEGCQLMLLRNHAGGDYVNGTMVKYVGHGMANVEFKNIPDSNTLQHCIFVQKQDGTRLAIPKHTFCIGDKFTEKYFCFESNKEQTKTRSQGEFTQYPARLGYAITIHKSQGMTLKHLEINCHKMFAEGQLYVSLSRATGKEGLRVLNFKKYHLKANKKAVQFYEGNL